MQVFQELPRKKISVFKYMQSAEWVAGGINTEAFQWCENLM